MMPVVVTRLPYDTESAELFAHVQHTPWAIFLDSCQPYSAQGRFDIIAAFPHTTLTTQDTISVISREDSIQTSEDCPFTLIRHIMGPPTPPHPTLPFTHGALGYFSYEFGAQLEKIVSRTYQEGQCPDLALGFYDCVIITDHQEQKRYWLRHTDHATHADRFDRFQECLQQPILTKSEFSLQSPLTSNFSFNEYEDTFNRVKTHIQQGDCYQVNLTQAFTADFTGDTWLLYQRLRKINSAPFASFMRLPEGEILSLSPERFLSLNNRHVITKPIKGTRPRSRDPQQDAALAQALLDSEKDRAENVMIVDLMRNDLGRVCQIGSIDVPALFALESFPAVHHLVSTVTGLLANDKDTLDLLRACLPGGSITGAPKIRAMQIIRELEPHRRSVYCGNIGYLDASGNMDTNIAIRTILCQEETLCLAVGGAVVADSTVKSEYQECFDKIRVIETCL